MAITIQTYNELLGQMVRQILPQTPVNDMSKASVILTLLEAAAANDFDNNSAVLSMLELLTIDALSNSDLDNRAADYGLTRISAQKASGSVTISDSSFSKRSTSLYALKPAPIAGSTKLYVNNASGWNATGYILLGRGTQSFEGPISYTSIVDNGTFYTINLASALQKDHLLSELVVDQQNKLDRRIVAGTQLLIPANNQKPETKYTVLRDVVLPAGEDTLSGVLITAVLAGSQGNAGIGTITSFSSAPFTGAAVTNTSAFTDGRDSESDQNLRERIKKYSSTLARGTKDAILTAIVGVNDPDDNKQVQSAFIKEPPAIGEPSIIYADDGKGFQPSYSGQSVDVLLASATGGEEFLQLSNYPLPRPQVVNEAISPFEMESGMKFTVLVDEVEDQIIFDSVDFNNIAAATLSEVSIAINNKATLFRCRLDKLSTRLLIYPTDYSAERIQVASMPITETASTWANSVFNFPTSIFSYISLFKNGIPLNEKESSASLISIVKNSWTLSNPSYSLSVSVDGTPEQVRTFVASDFSTNSLSTASLSEWVSVVNSKFAGLTAVATSTGALQITSNRSGNTSSLEITASGDLGGIIFPTTKYDQGSSSDFQLNRQTGNIRLLSSVTAGDSIVAGSADSKGNIVSTSATAGIFNLSDDSVHRRATAILALDATSLVVRPVSVAVGTNLTISSPGANVMRIMSSAVNSFYSINALDYIYITKRDSFLSNGNCGLFLVKAKGEHVLAGIDSYIDVYNLSTNVVAETKPVLSTLDIHAFKCDIYPQKWDSTMLSNSASASLADVTSSVENNVLGSLSNVYKTTYVKTTSTTEDSGSIASPVSIGSAPYIFEDKSGLQSGYQSYIASQIPQKDLIASFKMSSPVASSFFGRWVSGDVYSTVNDTNPSSETDPYAELLTSSAFSSISNDDTLSFSKGSNKNLFRMVKDIELSNTIGTQHNLPYTLMPHTSDSEVTLMKSASFSPDDNIVFVLDQDAVNNTVVVPMSRTGRIHSLTPPSNLSFSAYDEDNEAGITFDSLQVWGKTTNNTEFKDYAVWFKARNWYTSGGTGSGGASMIVRAKEYGLHGEKISFLIDYPTAPSSDGRIYHTNTPVETVVHLVLPSDTARSIGASDGLQFSVASLGGYVYRYTFLGSIDLTPVLMGDIISLSDTSGVSSSNRGTFRVSNKGTSFVDVYNPNGAATGLGQAEWTSITTTADVVGTPDVNTVQCTNGPSLNATNPPSYFKLWDDAGMVVVWYAVDNDPLLIQPPVVGVNRYVRVGTVAAVDSANDVAAKTALTLNTDSKFSCSVATDTIYVTNTFNGSVTATNQGNTGFTCAKTQTGTPDISLDGLYFKVHDINGSVAVWYDCTGSTSEPFHGASRSKRVSINFGDSANTVADLTATAFASDSKWTTNHTVGTNTIVLWDSSIGGRPAPSIGTTSFTITTTQDGSNASPETIVNAASFYLYPLVGNDVTSLVAVVNTSPVVEAAVNSVTSLTISKATRDEVYTPGSGYSASLAYGHNPSPSSGNNLKIRLYDALSWVKIFQNSAPNFTLKKSLTLQGASVDYNMGTVPNTNSTELGEMFKLVPVSIYNIEHQMTQKALSQLPIVANVNISNNNRRVQVKSKKLGSSGAVEIVGGRANKAIQSTFGDAQEIVVSGSHFVEIRTSASPFTANVGDYVKLTQANATKRAAFLNVNDSISVDKHIGLVDTDYIFEPRLSITTGSLAITHSTGPVYRWTFTDGVFTNVTVGCQLLSNVTGLGANNSEIPGSYVAGGYPIVAVDTLNKWVEVVNPNGFATSQGVTGTVNICPSPFIRWSLSHTTSTHYIIEKIGFNDLYRIRRVSGPSPRFVTSGVAVNDVVVISGTTFSTKNQGKFIILAVVEDHIVVSNSLGMEELNHIRPFNSSSADVVWSSGSNTVTGAAGSFANVTVGDWVKKYSDTDAMYLPVISIAGGGDSIQLGSVYTGQSSVSLGVALNQITGIYAGNVVNDINDITVYKADSIYTGDTLFIDKLSGTWFSQQNAGTFVITDMGTSTSYKPYVRVSNTSSISETKALSTNYPAIYFLEGDENRTEMVKKVEYAAIDPNDSTKRLYYLSSSDMTYKITQSNGSQMTALGKMAFPEETVTGIDGYQYYTGLLRRLQRIVDGYEPDSITYPGMRAIGGLIEFLPPIYKRVKLSLTVTTKDGFNINEISSNIISAVVQYVNSLDVGQDVILSAVVVEVMSIRGVAAVTITTPAAGTERITIDDTSKAYMESTDVSVA